MEINGVPYEIPYEKVYSLSGVGETYQAGKIGTTEYEISFRRTNDFLQTELLFTFAGNTLPDEDTVILGNNSSVVGLGNYLFADRHFECIDGLTGKLIFSHKSLDSLSGTFEFDGALYLGSGQYNMDSVAQVRKGKFCIKPSNL